MIGLLLFPTLLLAGVVHLLRSFFDWLRGE